MNLREFIPPIIVKSASSLRPQKYGWFGNYPKWEDAIRDASGYDSGVIVQKVKEALLKVKRGEAVYERDSVLFNEPEYSWPLLTGLMWIAASNNGELSVADFGGSLGSTYFQNKKFLTSLKKVKWSIVEQPLFVECGRQNFEDDVLKFYDNLDDCFSKSAPNVVLFSCVLQYLQDPYMALQSTFNLRPEYIIVNNIPFLETGQRLTLQRVPPEIYSASYPCWLLNRDEFKSFFQPSYEVISEYTSDLSIKVDNKVIPYEGFVFRRY